MAAPGSMETIHRSQDLHAQAYLGLLPIKADHTPPGPPAWPPSRETLKIPSQLIDQVNYFFLRKDYFQNFQEPPKRVSTKKETRQVLPHCHGWCWSLQGALPPDPHCTHRKQSVPPALVNALVTGHMLERMAEPVLPKLLPSSGAAVPKQPNISWEA